MIELTTHPTKNFPGPGVNLNESVERTALAGAAAIQRLIDERNGLRDQARAQESQLAGLHATNDDLRRRIALIGERYLELTNKFLDHLKEVDDVIRTTVQRSQGAAGESSQDAAGESSQDATLISLAQRLSPIGNRSPGRK